MVFKSDSLQLKLMTLQSRLQIKYYTPDFLHLKTVNANLSMAKFQRSKLTANNSFFLTTSFCFI